MDSRIITPRGGGRSVLSPEKQNEAYYKSADKMREALFVGAIMHFAESVHASGEYRLWRHEELDPPRYHLKSTLLVTATDAAQAIMEVLDTCIENKWNVAVEMLNWQRSRALKSSSPNVSPTTVEAGEVGAPGVEAPN